MYKPAVALFNVTYACNNRCKWCYASPMGFKDRMMSTADAKEFLRLSKEMGIEDVGVLGGEPTLHPEIFEIISSASKLGLRVSLYTNARKLADERFVKKLKDSGVYVVQADIHSSDPEKHDCGTRVKGSFGEAVKGIENCYRNGVRFRILCVLCSGSFENYRGIIDRFASMNPLFVFFREIPLINKLENQRILKSRKTAELTRKLYSYSKMKGVDISVYFNSPLCWLRKSEADMMIDEGVLINYCHVLDGRCLSIDVNGKVIPCVHWPGYHVMDMKDNDNVISQKEFLSRWNSPKLNGMRHDLNRYPSKECANCSHYGINCRGGCPLVKFELGPFHGEYQK